LRALDAFYVGPEVQAFGADDNYNQFRAGLHVTGLRTGELEWSAGAGWAIDSDDESSVYGKLSVLMRR
ncbi:MAG: cellulose biosynthesis protein BcsS, partial [Pseudorhodoplanes sp.]